MDLEIIQSLIKQNQTKIVFLVIDGIGGLEEEKTNKTELEVANTPNLDQLTAEGICGLQAPVHVGITPGSGPGHLGIFGYNPIKYQVGRGVLAANGIGFDLKEGDVAARGNFCTILDPLAKKSDAEHTSGIVGQFITRAFEILKNENPANMVILRGFSKKPCWPQMPECFGLRSAAISAYPMYRGLGKLIGMEVLETGETISDEFDTLLKHWDDYDFFYIHVKKTDSHGEDGNFEKKKMIIEEVDQLIPRLRSLNPDVIVVTGDHSTPSKLKMHSWHPVPVLLWSRFCRKDEVKSFGERACIQGGLGTHFAAENLVVLALANAGRLEKFGA
jgi:2,3-bisphosphoglycerate-independent phosphoglycerate mutase